MEPVDNAPTRTQRPVGYVVPDKIHEPLYVVTTVTNPLRWKNRWKRYEQFAKHVADSGGVLYTVEVAFGERDHAIGHAARDEWRAKCDFEERMIREHRWIQLRVEDEIWTKEAALNVGVSRLPADWKYVAWVDADVLFQRPNWVGECIHQLQHYEFLQMFSHAQDLGPDYAVINAKPSFVHAYLGNTLPLTGGEYPYYYGKRKGFGAWSGLAWACKRRAWDHVGGLMNFCITGAADWYMAFALIGKAERVVPKNSHPRFREAILRWQELAERHVRRNVGVMTGSISHLWHGPKRDRKYVDRSLLLGDLQFDPSRDMKFDWQGMPHLCDDGTERFIDLRDGIRQWFRGRNEDSSDL